MKDIIGGYDGELYFCRDGDLAICWRGRIKEIKDAIIQTLLIRYPSESATNTPLPQFSIYETSTHGEELRLIFREKLRVSNEVKPAVKPAVVSSAAVPETWEPVFTSVQLQFLENALKIKTLRKEPLFLVIEDQDFSRKLLTGLLEQNYSCMAAKDARQALNIYAHHAPDMVFLDIELPDADGHKLANVFKRHDPQCYVVMVTGNNHVDDVVKAKANKVQGFIVKPYNKNKIMQAVDTFIARRGVPKK